MDPSRRKFLRSGASVGGVIAAVFGRTGPSSAVARPGGGSSGARAPLGGGMHARQVIINADDFGMSVEIDRGILEAHDRGVVTSASLMVNEPDAEAAIEQ